LDESDPKKDPIEEEDHEREPEEEPLEDEEPEEDPLEGEDPEEEQPMEEDQEEGLGEDQPKPEVPRWKPGSCGRMGRGTCPLDASTSRI